jgi:signal transduction histidine kinase
MTAALGETAQRRAEADEARRFLVTSVAHDLRTPLFALRGHLQAIGSRLGNLDVHLERAEARADALDRLIGNLFCVHARRLRAAGASSNTSTPRSARATNRPGAL